MARKLAVLACIATIFLLTCKLAEQPADLAAGDSTQQATGTVTLRIPSVAPFVVMDKSEASSKALRPKTYMGATRIAIALSDSYYAERDSWWSPSSVSNRGYWEVSQTISSTKTGAGTASFPMSFPVGTFWFNVYVYNDYNYSPTAEPDPSETSYTAAYAGLNAQCTVTAAGPNIFHFTVGPAHITPLTQDAEAVEGALANQWSEQWYNVLSLTSDNATTTFSCVVTAGDADIYVFDQATLALVGSSYNAGTTADTVEVTEPADGNQYTYYLIGVWAYEANTAFTIECTQPQGTEGTVVVD